MELSNIAAENKAVTYKDNIDSEKFLAALSNIASDCQVSLDVVNEIRQWNGTQSTAYFLRALRTIEGSLKAYL